MALNGELSTSNNNAVEQKIEEIINKRKAMRPIVEAKLNKLYSLNSDVKSMNSVLDNIVNNDELDDFELKESCQSIKSQNIISAFSEGITALERIRERFNRESINIGVTGHSQVGKSTLLQGISGLGNEQIPSGDGKPTTAARSRIFNVSSKLQEGATITFYSESEFIKVVLKPYFNELKPFFDKIGGGSLHCPISINEFLKMNFPVKLNAGYFERVSDEFKNTEAEGKKPNAEKEAVLKRLWEMQHDADTWKDLINQPNKRINLSEIKKYIAYPTDEEIEIAKKTNSICERAYLAVQDVKIECCFKNANVQHLGIFDLPGLGEIIPQESMFCIMQYSTELDLTVLITRPTNAYKAFTDHDAKALANANDVRLPVKKAEDFTVIVVNKDVTGGMTDADVASLKKEIETYYGESTYHIFTGDIRNSDDLQSILNNILNHLASRLEQMDKDYLDEALEKSKKLSNICDTIKKQLAGIIRKYNTSVPPAQISNKAYNLKKNLAKSFADLRKKYKKYSEEGRMEDELSLKTDIARICKENDEWAETGLGHESPENWITYAESFIAGKNGIGDLIDFEFNRMRTRLSKCWSQIDVRLRIKIQKMYADISEIIKQNVGELVSCEPGEEYLRKFLYACEHLDVEQTGDVEVCESVSEALNELLRLNIQYRSLYNKSTREELEELDKDRVMTKYMPEMSKEGNNLELCFKRFKNIFIKTNNAIKAGLEEQAVFADWIIYNSLVYFVDVTMYSETSDEEFNNLCYSYTDLIFADPKKKFMTIIVSELKEISKKLGDVVKALTVGGLQ